MSFYAKIGINFKDENFNKIKYKINEIYNFNDLKIFFQNEFKLFNINLLVIFYIDLDNDLIIVKNQNDLEIILKAYNNTNNIYKFIVKF